MCVQKHRQAKKAPKHTKKKKKREKKKNRRESTTINLDIATCSYLFVPCDMQSIPIGLQMSQPPFESRSAEQSFVGSAPLLGLGSAVTPIDQMVGDRYAIPSILSEIRSPQNGILVGNIAAAPILDADKAFFPRVLKLRQLQLSEGKIVECLRLEQRGMAPIPYTHHVTKVLDGEAEAFRVRICRSCSGYAIPLNLRQLKFYDYS